MKSEASSFPHAVHSACEIFPLSHSKLYVGVSHARQIRYSGSPLTVRI